MTMMRKTATALLAAAGLAVAVPAFAGNTSTSAWAHARAGHSSASAESHVTRTGWRDDGRRDGRFRWDDDNDWRHDGRGDHDNWRHHRRDRRVDNRWDRHDNRWDRRHWRVNHHPHYRRWVGHRAYGRDYVVVRNYSYYGLPAPRYGYYYARQGDDVFLVAEATKRIIDAFVLLDATRY